LGVLTLFAVVGSVFRRPASCAWSIRGSEEFRQELLAGAAERVGASHCAADGWESGEELRRGGWKEGDLPGKRKGDKFKVRLARRLRRETTMGLKWFAMRLHMGSWAYVSNLLHEKRNN
jgi:hypothetical protein